MGYNLGPSLAMDIGTKNCSVFAEGQGLIQFKGWDNVTGDVITTPRIPSYVVLGVNENGEELDKVKAVGFDAHRYIDRTSAEDQVKVVRCVTEGTMDHLGAYAFMLRHLAHEAMSPTAKFRAIQGLRDVTMLRRLVGTPQLIVGVPENVTEPKFRAIESLIHDMGYSPQIVSEAAAAAIGAKLFDENMSGASFIVDVGGGTTDVAVIRFAEVVKRYTKSFPYAGDLMDQAIVDAVKDECQLEIGLRQAEWAKRNFCVVDSEGGTWKAKGLDLLKRQTKVETISSRELNRWISPILGKIADVVKQHIANIPGQLHEDFVNRGIFLTGGGAMVAGLKEAISEATNLQVTVVDDPLDSVIMGCGRMLSDPELLELAKFRYPNYFNKAS